MELGGVDAAADAPRIDQPSVGIVIGEQHGADVGALAFGIGRADHTKAACRSAAPVFRSRARGGRILATAAGARRAVLGNLSAIGGARTVADEVNKLRRLDPVIHNADIAVGSRGTDGSNPVPSSGESTNFRFLFARTTRTSTDRADHRPRRLNQRHQCLAMHWSASSGFVDTYALCWGMSVTRLASRGRWRATREMQLACRPSR